jgi:hypothetical protein
MSLADPRGREHHERHVCIVSATEARRVPGYEPIPNRHVALRSATAAAGIMGAHAVDLASLATGTSQRQGAGVPLRLGTRRNNATATKKCGVVSTFFELVASLGR